MNKKNGVISKEKRNDLIFYILMLAFPMIQFIIGYVVTNFNSVFLAFQKYDYSNGLENAQIKFAGFENFRHAFLYFKESDFLVMFKNTIIVYFFQTLLGLIIGIYLSYYIYKKHIGSKFFKTILLMPSVISGVVMILSFRFFMDKAYPAVIKVIFNKNVSGLLSDSSTDFVTILIYNLLVGFGSVVLLFSGTMSGIADEITEAANLDGVNTFQELFYIVIPLIYPTVITFLLTGIASFFIVDMGLFNLYGDKAESRLWTYGYYLFNETQGEGKENMFPLLSSMGIIFTIIIVSITFIVKYLLEKIGPKVD